VNERHIHVELADRAGCEELLRTTRVADSQDPDGLSDIAERLIQQARRVSAEALRHVTAGRDLIRAERASVAGKWAEVAAVPARSGPDMTTLLELEPARRYQDPVRADGIAVWLVGHGE
jgi:hypothetical protein